MKNPKIQELCQKYSIVPNKERGQHFLVDRGILDVIIRQAELRSTETVLEVGPGFGILTQELAQRVQRVIAVELDQKLADALQEMMKDMTNVEIVNDDIFHWADRETQPYTKIVANLPYQITGRFFRFFLGRASCPELIVVMIQKEVAERIVAPPGEMSMLSLMVQYYSTPTIVRFVPKTSFWPEPNVDSAIIRLLPHPQTSPHPSPARRGESWRGEGEEIFRLARIGFSSRRKQLQHNLAGGLRLSREDVIQRLTSIGLAPTVRAQELSLENWVELAQVFSKASP